MSCQTSRNESAVPRIITKMLARPCLQLHAKTTTAAQIGFILINVAIVVIYNGLGRAYKSGLAMRRDEITRSNNVIGI